MTHMNRRNLVKLGASGLALGFLPRLPGRAFGQNAAAPHFFLDVMLVNGWDPSYLFDARPLAMTAAGKIQNYLGKEPTQWQGANGVVTLGTELSEPLRPYFPYFSILNGVHMAAAFDGHDQNRNFLLTGNPFGGEMLLPHLNAGPTPASLDYLQVGMLSGVELSNAGGGVLLQPQTALAVAGGASALSEGAAADPSDAYLQARLAAAGAGQPQSGLFAEGAAAMRKGLADSRVLGQRMQGLSLPMEADDLTQALSLAHQYFKRGIARSAFLTFEDFGLDTHDAESCKTQPERYKSLVQTLVRIFKFLKETPLDAESGPALIDSVTLTISSEFGRTLRQTGKAIDATGTDHNPLSNTVLLGGKGIKGGWVVGASDQHAADEQVTLAHQKMDPELVKAMGKPFDFAELKARSGYQPTDFAEYKAEDYLGYASVANTVYTLFGVDQSKHWLLKRNGDPAPALAKLLA